VRTGLCRSDDGSASFRRASIGGRYSECGRGKIWPNKRAASGEVASGPHAVGTGDREGGTGKGQSRSTSAGQKSPDAGARSVLQEAPLTAEGDATSGPLRQANAAYRQMKQTFCEGSSGQEVPFWRGPERGFIRSNGRNASRVEGARPQDVRFREPQHWLGLAVMGTNRPSSGYVFNVRFPPIRDVRGDRRLPERRPAGLDQLRSFGQWARDCLPLAVEDYSGRVFVLVWAAGDWRDERDPETGSDPLLGCGRL
jgi:hypothetical protein